MNHLIFMNDLKLYGRQYSPGQKVREFSSHTLKKVFESTLTVVVIKRGKLVKSQGIKLPDERIFT